MVHSRHEKYAKSVCFYRADSGREPVREWLARLPPRNRQLIGRDIMTLQLGWPIGMPTARKLADNLWEIRSRLSEGNARILFTVREDKIVLLHGFIKKSQKTPQRDLRVARQRLSKL